MAKGLKNITWESHDFGSYSHDQSAQNDLLPDYKGSLSVHSLIYDRKIYKYVQVIKLEMERKYKYLCLDSSSFQMGVFSGR